MSNNLIKSILKILVAGTLCVAGAAQANADVSAVSAKLSDHDRRQIECMARNTYFEARGEPHNGQVAVNNVVMNRVQDSRFPSTPCAVIHQRTPRVCQFSWVCQNRRNPDVSSNDFRHLKLIATKAYLGLVDDITRGALYFHSGANPGWRKTRTIRIGGHNFYR
jgi:spore germination cell wall hydrolase CwlJ-like protein